MKRVISVLMVICLISAFFSACGSDKTSKTGATTAKKYAASSDLATSFDGLDNVAFVMIYNPDIYDEQLTINNKMSTGSVEEWVNPYINRSDDEATPNKLTLSQADFTGDLDKIHSDFSVARASSAQPKFTVGDKKAFYHTNETNAKETFTCTYVGAKCYIWVQDVGSIDTAAVEKLAEEFDSVIYDSDVEMFGEPRYADDGGKIHLLFHSMEQGLAGYFDPKDLFSSGEVTTAEIAQYGLNTDLAIIHINSLIANASYETMLYATVAHEFQHLINCTDFFEYNHTDMTPTWINEAMSGYAEEKIYPGVQEADGRYEDLYSSAMIRHGQSLYNFDTNYPDIGVYGSVFLYSQYLENLAGENVFKSLHDFWRAPTGELTISTALRNCVPSDVESMINDKYDYAGNIRFDSKDDEWMSKLTLDFYVSLLNHDASNAEAIKEVETQALFYDEVNAADIEGGGRVIINTKNGTFQVPDGADQPLVYIGFDSNFKQITAAIIK